MSKSIFKLTPLNIDFIYVMLHVLFADYSYKRSIMSKGLTDDGMDKYVRMLRTYFTNKFSGFNADLLDVCQRSVGGSDHIMLSIKIYPNKLYEAYLPLNRFSQEILCSENGGEHTILDFKYLRFDMQKEIRIDDNRKPKPKQKPKPPKKSDPKGKKPKKFMRTY